jgi:hypothetical protein
MCTAGELGLPANISVLANITLLTRTPELCVLKAFTQNIRCVRPGAQMGEIQIYFLEGGQKSYLGAQLNPAN